MKASGEVYVTITGEGTIYLENKFLTSRELKERMSGLLTKDPDLKVVIAADKSCRFQDVVGVMDMMKELGVKSLNIATRTDKKKALR